MASNDQIIGLIITIVAAVAMVVEAFLLIFAPLTDPGLLGGFPEAQYWAIVIPLFLGVFGVLGIVLWIGVTMFRTPPPESWDFEDFEDEEESQEKAEETAEKEE